MSEKEEDENDSGERCYAAKSKNKEGSVCVIPERCKGCEFCIEFCPAQALEPSENTTEKGYRPPEMTGDCVLCGKCEKICPEFAIYIKEKEEEDEEKEEKEDEERGECI
ncbi:MAG: 4Fe-4S dicluster domain-containing protein [Candidatus Thermoplasmatota archaeon]